MSLELLKSVIALVADSTIVELKFSEGDTHISLVRRIPGSHADDKPGSPPADAAPVAVSEPVEPVPDAGLVPVPAAASPGAQDIVVLAPMASVFHRSPSPLAKPFIDVGDACEPGAKLCILEAMKVFTVLDAECAGTVAEFYVMDGEEVDIDQPLIRISRG